MFDDLNGEITAINITSKIDIQSPAANYFHSSENLKAKALDFGPLILCSKNNMKSPSRKQLYGEFFNKNIALCIYPKVHG